MKSCQWLKVRHIIAAGSGCNKMGFYSLKSGGNHVTARYRGTVNIGSTKRPADSIEIDRGTAATYRIEHRNTKNKSSIYWSILWNDSNFGVLVGQSWVRQLHQWRCLFVSLCSCLGAVGGKRLLQWITGQLHQSHKPLNLMTVWGS